MDLLTAHGNAIAAFDARVRIVADDQWDRPTPDDEWDVRALVNHLTSEQLWAPELLAGRTIADVGTAFDGDVLGRDPVGAWAEASAHAREAFLAPGALERTVNLSFGDTAAFEYCEQMTFDLVVHSWDLARAIGAEEELDADLVAMTLRFAEAQPELFTSGSYFAGPVPATADDDLTRLLALTGRRR